MSDKVIDPWKDKIFEERKFSTLVVSITADEEELYSEESGILNGQYSPAIVNEGLERLLP